MRRLLEYLNELGYGSLATLAGRYYAMDRDKRYDRIKIAYEGMTQRKGEEVETEKLINVRARGGEEFLFIVHNCTSVLFIVHVLVFYL